MNNQKTKVQNPVTKEFENFIWADIKIGDIVKVEKN